MKHHFITLIHHPLFRKVLSGIALFFVVLTYFISVTPDSFIKFGYAGIFVFNALSSGLLLIPILLEKFNLYALIFVSALGNIPNTSINYLLGATSSSLFGNNPLIGKAKLLLRKFGLVVVYAFAVIPFPIDINGLLSGYVGIPYLQYIAVNFLGKLTIFLLVGLGVLSFDFLSGEK
jgi:membrane protein YqaA with SNARE-associated domain